MSYTFTFRNANKGQDGTKPNRLLGGKGSERRGPVRVLWEAREMQTKAKSALLKKNT
jgi:hypothetical protein